MKNIFLTTCLLWLSGWCVGQGIEFFEGSWEEALVKAEQEEKLIFVDAFAVWCGPCKRMAKNVFTNPSVGEYFNDNFVNLKIDMEKGMGLDFGVDYPVSAFPTLFFISSKGDIVKKVVGGRDVKSFIDLGKEVIASFDRSGEYAELYNSGNRDFELVLKYVKALNRANKSSLKVSNEYLRKNTELSGEKRAEFLFEAMTHADSRIFDLFIQDRALLEKIRGKASVESKIEAACWNTIYNAIEYEMAELNEEAKKKMQAHCGEKYKTFALEADYEFAKSIDNIPMMCDAAVNLAENLLADKPEDLHLLAENLYMYKSLDEVALDASSKILGMALDIAEKPEYLITDAQILMAQGRNKKAIKRLKRALEVSGNDAARVKEINELMQKIQEG